MDGRYARRRGRRIPIAMSLQYREHGTSVWRRGTTVNASHSGMLFRAGGLPPRPARRLEIILMLPTDGGVRPVQVRCSGRVVRMEPSALLWGGHAVAVSLDGCAAGSGVRELRGRVGILVPREWADRSRPPHPDVRDPRPAANLPRTGDMVGQPASASAEARVPRTPRGARGGDDQRGGGDRGGSS